MKKISYKIDPMVQRLVNKVKDWDLAIIYPRGRQPIMVETAGEDYHFKPELPPEDVVPDEMNVNFQFEPEILVLTIPGQVYPTPDNYGKTQSDQEVCTMQIEVKVGEIVSIEFFSKNRVQLIT